MKPISVQKVMSILKKAGLPKGRGTFLTTFDSGYVVRKEHIYPEGYVVRVFHRDKRRDFGKPYDASTELATYKGALEAAGVVIIPSNFTDHEFVCTGIKEDA